MSKNSASQVPYHMPLAFQPEKKIGAGKDNRVYSMSAEYSRRDIDPTVAARAGGLVVKSGNLPDKKGRYTVEMAAADAKYKLEKYNLLKRFLGDYIPDSHFLVGSQRNPDGEVVVKPLTVQDRVPQVTLQQLPKEVRNSDELRGEMYGLARRLQTMHKVLNRARTIVERTGDAFVVDAALDLGPFSDYVKDHTEEDPAGFNYAQMINGYKDSPNLLVDPDTLQLSCIDFGSGQWSGELGAQMAVVYDIAAHDEAVRTQLPGQPAPAIG